MKTSLITAYAVNPYHGSEDGTGWNISRQVATEHKTIIVTRKNNRPEIERYMAEVNDPVHANMQFMYYDLPNWAMFWKKMIGPRGYVLYYYLWQLFMPLFIIKNNLKFDIAHACNFHSDSHPNFLWLFGKPTVWGPIGHHPKMPHEYIKHHGSAVVNTDRKYAAVKWILRTLDPFFHLAVWKSDAIIGINSSVQKVIRADKKKMSIIPAVASVKPKATAVSNEKKFQVLSVGRFTPMKGFDITVKAFAKFYRQLPVADRANVKMKLVGKGEDEQMLLDLIFENGLEKAVEMVNWVELSEMPQIYADSNLYMFPSHEGAGMVVPEAMSYGLPVVCFDNVGPGELIGEFGIKIPYKDYETSVSDYANAISDLYFDPAKAKQLSDEGKIEFDRKFTWETKGQQIRQIYRRLLNPTMVSAPVFFSPETVEA
ncbi:MAG: glycosyltransferase involved in cell wall biosynthesis [Granulosicoccus sp.]|jgi:glycosyltransferase involved in cell wall biosynthesis